MDQDTGKPNRFKIAAGCFFAGSVFVLLIGVVAVAASYVLDFLKSMPPATSSDRDTKTSRPVKVSDAAKQEQARQAAKKRSTSVSKTKAPQKTTSDTTKPALDVERIPVEFGDPNVEPPKPLEPAKQEAPVKREAVAGAWPPMLAMDTRGTLVNLDDYKGKVVLVDFWATWCDPYVRNLPRLKEAYAKHHANGLEIIGVCLNDDSIFMSNFMRKNGMTWRQIQASDGYDSPTVQRWKVTDLPAAFIIGRDGKISQAGVAGENITRLIEVEMRR